jgi:hypothetical protein
MPSDRLADAPFNPARGETATRLHHAASSGKCEGRKSYAERDPELVLTAKRLRRRSPKGRRRSLREIASELAGMGYRRGAPYSASCIKSMVEGPSP